MIILEKLKKPYNIYKKVKKHSNILIYEMKSKNIKK